MTIHGIGYRGWEERPAGLVSRLWPLALGEFMVLFRSRLGLLALFVMALPVLVHLVVLLMQMGVLSVFEEGQFLRQVQERGEFRLNAFSRPFYVLPVQGEALALFLIPGTLVLCRAVAKDRQSNALELFWTRPISPAGYFLAKWFGGFLLVASIWVVGPLLLWLIGLLTSPVADFASTTAAFLPRTLAAGLWSALVMTGLAVALSATTASANFASIQFVMLLLGTQAVGRVADRLFRDADWPGVLAPWDSMVRVAEGIAGIEPSRDIPLVGALVSLGVVAAVLAVLVRRKLQLEEALA